MPPGPRRRAAPRATPDRTVLLSSPVPPVASVGESGGWLLWIAAGVAGLLVLAALDVWARRAVVRFAMPFFEREPPFNLSPEPPDPAATTVRVEVPGVAAADGSPLSLAVAVAPAQGPPKGVVVFCPETGGSRWFYRRYAAALPPAGFAVVSFEHRGMNDSDAEPGYVPDHWPTEREVADALAVVRAVLDRPAEFGLRPGLPVGVYGLSRGACVALAAAAREPRVRAAASDGGFVTDRLVTEFARKWAVLAVPKWFAPLIPTWHIRQTMGLLRLVAGRKKGVRYLSLRRDLRRLAGRPAWIVGGTRDSYVTPEQTRLLAAKLGVEPWLVPRAKHNLARETAGAEYDARLAAFFERALAG